ncbi:MAG: hypothetical protein GWO20_19200 [Candidatus Korarchaeota archaeon]|nr:hypothetical protein [Candidatus Korarchaeota archaeon]NIU85384.1 hypothetical protein [Candidatus Thorarchaeota archaeon]NIW15482.1 hypothetical protein [Candidatus Thorarchaeota archaeon]NIW53426.1 hypothetical protein [Candidatus Korarchaeota archaeon]
MSINHLSSVHKRKIKKLLLYCFYAGLKERDAETWEKYFSIVDLPNSLGYFLNEELVSTLLLINFRLFVRSVLMDAGGIAGSYYSTRISKKGIH